MWCAHFSGVAWPLCQDKKKCFIVLFNKSGLVENKMATSVVTYSIRESHIQSNSAFEGLVMLWSFVFRLALLSLQRLHRTWKQDIHHRAGVWPWQLWPLHLPSRRTQTDPRSLRPRLQHVLCCPRKPHQKPFPILPHEGEISIMMFLIAKLVLEPMDIRVQSYIIINLSFFFCI